MANKYEKRGKVVEFEEGDYYIIKVFKKDRPSDIIIIIIIYSYCILV
jgi:hypothetical protein